MKITYQRLQQLQKSMMQLSNLPHQSVVNTLHNIDLIEETLTKGTKEAEKVKGFKEYQERHNTEWRFFLEKNQINPKRQLTQQEQQSWNDRLKRFNEKEENKIIIDALIELDNKIVDVDIKVITDLTNVPPVFILNNKELFSWK